MTENDHLKYKFSKAAFYSRILFTSEWNLFLYFIKRNLLAIEFLRQLSNSTAFRISKPSTILINISKDLDVMEFLKQTFHSAILPIFSDMNHSNRPATVSRYLSCMKQAFSQVYIRFRSKMWNYMRIEKISWKMNSFKQYAIQ